MAGRFSYSSPGSRGLTDPWFRIGDVDVGSAALMALVSAISMVMWAFSRSFTVALALIPSEVRSGEIWRLVTWPFANTADLWTVIAIALLWYIGSQLEVQIGRVRMATMLGIVTLMPGLVGTALGLPEGGIDPIEFVVLLLFIAEYPNVRFFFGIPGWVLGAVFVGIQVLQLLGLEAYRELLFFLCTLVVGAFAGRAVGLLSNYEMIPRFPLPASLSGERKRRATRRSGNAPRRNHRGQVVDGPWTAPPPPGAPSADVKAAQAELDDLLDKISADGLDSLNADEKRRLNELSKKLR